MQIPAGVNYFDIMGLAQKNYGKLLGPICVRHDLTRNELDVLLFLHNNPQYDRAADIVAHRGMAKSHVSLSVSNLEGKGLLVRKPDESDRRAARLALTEQGSAIAGEARAAQEEFFRRIHQGVSPEEFALWGGITRKICENIQNLDKTLTTD